MDTHINSHEIISSEYYIDLVVEYTNEIANIIELDELIYSFHSFGEYLLLHIHKDRFSIFLNQMSNRTKYNFPIPMGILDEIGLAQSGIEYFHTQPYIQLKGNGVVIAIIDTGIDYLHPAFIHPNNTTKILRIWDQTIDGIPPNEFYFGHEYTSEDINGALQSENPQSIVNHTDSIGHGTVTAGIAVGYDGDADFTGVAPEAELIIIKVKPAKQNFKNQWVILKEGTDVYQETDIILAIQYITKITSSIGKPVVINISFGTNNSAHDNTGIGSTTIMSILNRRGFAIVSAVGNESIAGHHISGVLNEQSKQYNIELKVGEKEKGFCLDAWVQAPDVMSVLIKSPMNEYVEMIPDKSITNKTSKLLLEKTEITIEAQLSHFINGDQVIRMKLRDPTPGIWTVTLRGHVNIHQRFNVWLPLRGWIEEDTFFIDPDPYYTATSPGASINVIAVGAYNYRDGSLYIHSGRGPSRIGSIRPDIVAPGVNMRAPWPNKEYNYISGTSVASAMVAGSVALLLEWGIVHGNDPSMNTVKVRNYLIRGAKREDNISYPNNIWGYGTLDLYGVFRVMII